MAVALVSSFVLSPISLAASTLPDGPLVCFDAEIFLDGTGNVVLAPSEVAEHDQSVLTLSVTNFNCADLGENTISVNAPTGSSTGGDTTCVVTVMVRDTVRPVLDCGSVERVIATGNDCMGEDLGFPDFSVIDNCVSPEDFFLVGIQVELISDMPLTGPLPLGTYNFEYRYEDPSGNADTCTYIVEVVDRFPPSIECRDTVVYLDESGTVSIDPTLLATASDFCDDEVSIESADNNPLIFDCINVGQDYNVRLIARDDTETLSASCNSRIRILDSVSVRVELALTETLSCENQLPEPNRDNLQTENICEFQSCSDRRLWINEFRFAYTDEDQRAFVEIAGPVGTSLAGHGLAFYDAATGRFSFLTTIGGFGETLVDEGGGHGTYIFSTGSSFFSSEDGSGGIVLFNFSGEILEFISYGGSFTTLDGPSIFFQGEGLTSTDIGIPLADNIPTNFSLQRSGTGGNRDDFTWQPFQAASPDAFNSGQTIIPCIEPIITSISFLEQR
ncbi:MAG: hypothetical protein AAGF89_10575, partial [Bacteroidota bacterium]